MALVVSILESGTSIARVSTIKLLLKMVLLLHRLIRNSELIIARGCSIVIGMIFLSLTGCGAGGEQEPMIPTSSTPSGSTISLIWDPVNESNIIGYYIHYGKQSPNQPGSCAYDQAMYVSSTQGTVTGLDPGSTYYFAVSAYNGVRGVCSNEVYTET
ncbi:MAG: fibronectin type III domain-containing protein [Nitrospira sp.]|nr:fibronectin type III domain-containing protein [Nitrospira sp.]